MKYLISALSVAAATVGLAFFQDVEIPSEGGLFVALAPAKDKSGSPSIERDGVFQVVFTNRSGQPIRLWSETCQLGYETLSFTVEDEQGNVSRMYKRTTHPSNWRNKPALTITIPPGGNFSENVAPGSIWGERVWKGVPEPNTGQPIKLSAVFEISSTDAAKEHDVWTGRIESEPISTLVVDTTLQTPHEYLDADCPQQALRMIQADKAWMRKKDDYYRTPLHLAASRGFTDVAQWLLSNGADVDATACNRFTPLHLAGEPEMVKLLVQHKANVDAKSSRETALQRTASRYAHFAKHPEYAAEREKLRSITQILLEAGAEYDILSACYFGDLERVRLLAKDKDLARDKNAMRQAATYGQAEIVKLLLEHGADPEDADYGGMTVSYFAIEHPEVLKLLFDAGADPKVAVDYQGDGIGPQGSTLLHGAAEKGFVESAKLLLSKGLNIDAVTPYGYTPLHVACSGGHAKMVELLLENNANVEAVTQGGLTPMSLAALKIRPEREEDNAEFEAVIREIARRGLEIDLFVAIAVNDLERVTSFVRTDPKCGENSNTSGRPALHSAVTLDRMEMLKLLLDNGCDPDVRSEDIGSGHERETALLDAAFWGRLEAAELLIKHGASVVATANRGVTPLHEAARMGHLDIARLLLMHGANANAKDDKGKTPIDWAQLYGEAPEMVEMLRHSPVKGSH